MREKRKIYYFTDKGDYGDAKGLIRVDVTEWSESDWARILDSHPSVRKKTAIQVEHKHRSIL